MYRSIPLTSNSIIMIQIIGKRSVTIVVFIHNIFMQNKIETVQGQYSLVGQPDIEHVSILYNTQSCIHIIIFPMLYIQYVNIQFPKIYSSYNYINRTMCIYIHSDIITIAIMIRYIRLEVKIRYKIV